MMEARMQCEAVLLSMLIACRCMSPASVAVAGITLVRKAGGEVAEAACIIELPELKGREKVAPCNVDLFVLVQKEGL